MTKGRVKYDPIKALTIKKLAAKHECTLDQVRKAVRNDIDSLFAQELRKDYKIVYNQLAQALN